jgi:hypothetical protein
MTYGGRERNRERERNRVRERETRKKRELRVALGSLSLEAKKNFCLGLSSNASHSSKALSEEEKGKHRLFLSLSLSFLVKRWRTTSSATARPWRPSSRRWARCSSG